SETSTTATCPWRRRSVTTASSPATSRPAGLVWAREDVDRSRPRRGRHEGGSNATSALLRSAERGGAGLGHGEDGEPRRRGARPAWRRGRVLANGFASLPLRPGPRRRRSNAA